MLTRFVFLYIPYWDFLSVSFRFPFFVVCLPFSLPVPFSSFDDIDYDPRLTKPVDYPFLFLLSLFLIPPVLKVDCARNELIPTHYNTIELPWSSVACTV